MPCSLNYSFISKKYIFDFTKNVRQNIFVYKKCHEPDDFYRSYLLSLV